MWGATIVPDVENGTWTSRKLPGVVSPFEAPMRVFSARVVDMDDWESGHIRLHGKVQACHT